MAESVLESVTVHARPDDVWGVLMDPLRLEEWVSAHVKLEDVPDQTMVAGDGFRQRLGIGPVGFWVDWELLETDRPHFARWRGSGPGGSSAVVSYKLSEDGSGPESTLFEYENEFRPPGNVLGALAKRFVNAAAGRLEARRSMDRLKKIFETS